MCVRSSVYIETKLDGWESAIFHFTSLSGW